MDTEAIKLIVEAFSGMTDGAFWGFVAYLGSDIVGSIIIASIFILAILSVKKVILVLSGKVGNRVELVVYKTQGGHYLKMAPKYAAGLVSAYEEACKKAYKGNLERQLRDHIQEFVDNG
jgi:hypothetical protein